MVNFKKVKLGDICDLQQGLCINRKSKHLIVTWSDLPLLRITDLINNKEEQYINSDIVSKQFISDEKSLIYTRTGQVGLVFKNRKGVVHNNCFKILPKDCLNKDFLFYILKQKNFYNNIQKIASKSAQPDLTHSAFKLIDINIPSDYLYQTQIASILSAYDDLIENNEKRIKALEEMAQLLYTEWFVKFKFPGHEKVKMVDSGIVYGMVPEGWEVKDVGDKLTITKGKNITKDTITDGHVPVVAGGLSPAYYHNKANAHNPVVTVSASGANSGFVNLYQEDIWASDCSYIDKEATSFVYFYYLFLRSKQTEITGLQKGSAQPHVYPKDLMRLLILDIPEILVREFENKAEVIFDSVRNLKKQNQNLFKTRDLLISLLVTGKRVLE